MVVQVDKKCANSVTTKTGTFTFYTQKVTSCQAEKFCRGLGHILAPITNMEDKRALHKVADQRCGIFSTPDDWSESYHVGLSNKFCGNEVYRVFSNGAAWNETLHRKMYWITGMKNSCYSTLWTPVNGITSRMSVLARRKDCSDWNLRFVCLDPAEKKSDCAANKVGANESVKSEAVVSGNVNSILWQLVGFCVLASICLLLFVIRMLRSQNKCLKINVDVLKEEIKVLKTASCYSKQIE